MKSQIDEMEKKNSLMKSQIDQTVHNIDVLIQHIRDLEKQIHHNEKQPINTYERLLVDCQVENTSCSSSRICLSVISAYFSRA